MPKRIITSCFAAVVLSFVILYYSSPEPQKGQQILGQSSVRPRTAGSLNYYNRDKKAGNYILEYGFMDFKGKKHRVVFNISEYIHHKLSDIFGYDPDVAEAETNKRIKMEIDSIIARSGYARYITYSLSSKRISIQSKPVSKSIFSDVQKTMNSITAYYSANYNRTYSEVIGKNGFFIEGDYIRIDYGKMAQWNRDVLRECYDALYRTGRNYSLSDYLGLFTAFIQEINYEIPPEKIGGKNTGGIYIPTDVLINNRGDCDSKAIAFACLWQNFTGTKVIIVQVPDHALVGVAVVPEAGQTYTRIGNSYYVLCEVAGPAKIYPGHDVSVKGTFSYYAIN